MPAIHSQRPHLLKAKKKKKKGKGKKKKEEETLIQVKAGYGSWTQIS